MPNALTARHIEAQRRLRLQTELAVSSVWTQLGAYDEANVEPWLGRVLPITAAANRHSVSLTDAYVAATLKRPAIGVDPETVVASLRNGTPPAEVWRRPFVTVWTALGAGTEWEQAVADGLARVTSTAQMDVQLASRATFQAIQEVDEGFYGYQRVADGGACEFCLEVDGAYVKSADAMGLHNRCGCSLEPLGEPHRLAVNLPNGVAVHEHGELGPMLGSPDHSFTTL